MALGKMSLALIRLDPGERQVKGQIRAEVVAAYIEEKSAIKGANKRVSNLGVMLLVACGNQWESAQLFKVIRSREPLVCIIPPGRM